MQHDGLLLKFDLNRAETDFSSLFYGTEEYMILHKDEATKSYNVCSPPRYKISDSVFLKGIVLLLRIQLVQ